MRCCKKRVWERKTLSGQPNTYSRYSRYSRYYKTHVIGSIVKQKSAITKTKHYTE